MDNTRSFTARRSAASNLPTFQLPPPDLSNMHKYQSYAPSSTGSTIQSVNNVLTPPANLPNDLSPLSSSVNSGSSGSSNSGIAPYNPSGYWPGLQNYSYSTPQMPSSFTQNPLFMNRQLYSPGVSFNGQRNASSPSTSEGLPPPPYDLNLPPFPSNSSMHGSGSSHQANLPPLPPQQQQQQVANLLMNAQMPASQASQPTAIHAPDHYGGRAPPTPTYSNYAPSSTPQQSPFPAYPQPSPTQQSPGASGGPLQSRLSPVSAQQSAMQPPLGQYSRSYGGFPLPAMSGPVMSNMHNPGAQMALVGGVGYPPQHMGQHMYGQHSGQPQQQNDRPFKCDQCPQSFNRNHDLKRHKRIHLAVKPFPCTHCEKSFSRKDALKRHILVKGCGKAGDSMSALPRTDSQSPLDRSEVMSDSASEDSPVIPKREL
ncbi:MAG: hypothetical protein M1818_006792 [Claussenomyces sp. TS43310]|nr:MAG: hypothetical protein M1818_006792 [Claussenomyces sp. TS43310]